MHRPSIAAQPTTLATQPIARKSCFSVVFLALALLVMAVFTHPAHAGVPVPRYAYVLDQAANSIEIFTMNLNTGVLAKTVCAPNPQPLPAGVVANSAKVDPTGSFLYVADMGLNQVLGFFIQPNGCLVAIPGSPWLTIGATPNSLHITADGEYLYVSDTCTPPGGVAQGCVEGFVINPIGGLAGFGPDPAGARQAGIAVDPVRQYIYAADDSPAGPINGTQYNPLNGTLAPWAAHPTATPNPHRMALDAVGNGPGAPPPATQFLLVVSDPPAAVVDCYLLNTAGGALAWAGAAPAGPNTHTVAVTPFGQFAYVTNTGANTVSAYNINNCAAIAANGVGVATGLGPTDVVVDQTGKFVYVTATGANQIWGYKINELNGTLVKIAAWATGAGPVAITTMP